MDDLSHSNLTELDLDTFGTEEKTLEKEKVVAALELLGKTCRQLLKLFYFENLPHKEIVIHMGYSSVEVSRSRRLNCIKQLRRRKEKRSNRFEVEKS